MVAELRPGAPTTRYPARLQAEPVDVRAFDGWQNGEGLVDASDAVRAAWAEFKPTWRAARAADFERQGEAAPARGWADGLDKIELHGLRRARALGAAWGMCFAAETKKALRPKQRAVWFRWRRRAMLADPGLWCALWPLVDGEAVEHVGERMGRCPELLKRQAALTMRWLALEVAKG